MTRLRLRRRPAPHGQRRGLRARMSNGLLLLVALAVIGGMYTAFAPAGRAGVTNTPLTGGNLVAQGYDLFKRGCSSCHGMHAEGSSQAPSLIGVGAAAVDYQVGTGRMPLATFGSQADRKPPKYSPDEIQALASYVASLAPGPAIPDPNYVNGWRKADIARGGELFRTNCSQCHNAIGEGGALGWGVYAPALTRATPKQMIEAMETGPEQMPFFSDSVITPSEKLAIVHYLMDVNKAGHTVGGHPIGRIGPVPEGAVAWIVGIGACVLFTLWIGSRIS